MAPISLPPGFRFHPTDEELVAYYLKGRIHGWKREIEIIHEVDIYKCEPWDLPEKSLLPGIDLEWYFFSRRDRKYPKGSRTNRATEAGYWKATGKDRKVISNMRSVGMKKTLVFYKDRAPYGSRTNWVMHEYRLDKNECERSPSFQDAHALCRVFKKNEAGPRNIEHQSGAPVENDFSGSMINLFNKNRFLSVEEQYEVKPSLLPHAEDYQTNSKETSSETINDINADDGALKRPKILHLDNSSCKLHSTNESTNHPKGLQAEHSEHSCPPLEVDDFSHVKTCLGLSDSRMPSTYIGSEQIHWSVEETEILEQLYRDGKTSHENNHVSHFIHSGVADIQCNEDYLQLIISSLGGTQDKMIKTTLMDINS